MEKNHHNNRDGSLLRSTNDASETRSQATTSSDFVLQWGNRKRLRCMKFQVRDTNTTTTTNKDSAGPNPVQRTTVRVDRRVVRSDHNVDSNQPTTATTTNNQTNGYLNLRQRPASPPHRILRNSESSIAMRGHSNGVKGRLASPDRGGAHDKKTINHHTNATRSITNNHNDDNKNGFVVVGSGGGSASSGTAHDSKKGGGSSSGSEAIPAVWPPKFVIALTNKEKEEDFMVLKGSKLPQRPKKRAKFIQRTVNLVSPGTWLCDLTLERYEVREKKVSKKRQRGLKAMGNMESDSE
ncbi:unnamed protein product [Ilex paraguariensis]|uniref:Uncharacterized protein n=1 Tax=Ilex paraguariensis TaxID=185542 RepID=A0ABC8RK17_9AQUA